MLKNITKKFLERFKGNPKSIALFLFGVVVLLGASMLLHKKISAEKIEKEHDFALSAVESTLNLSKTIKEFYNSDNDQNRIIKSKSRFSEIASQLKSLSDAKMGTQFISTIRKTSEFFSSYCDQQIDLLNKTKAIELDLSVNNHFDSAKFERLLSDKSKYDAKANQVQNEVLQAIPKAFTEWKKVLSPEDCHMIFGYIDKNFEEEKKKMSDNKVTKDEGELYLHEWIAMQINEEVFNRWMEKELSDILNKLPSIPPEKHEIDGV